MHEKWESLLAHIANAADGIALQYFRSASLEITHKPGDGTPVTQADVGIEKAARRIVEAGHPGLGVLGEELGAAGDSDGTRLIIDPIDGTQNFARGIPIFATLLAIEHNGEIVAGLVSAPALGTRWSAVRGGGALRNGERIRVSRVSRLEEAQLFHAGVNVMGAYAGAVVALAQRVRRSRGFGDFYQHVLVAEGAGEVAVDFDLKPWDLAPLAVIVEEAGGRYSTASGERTIYGGSFIPTNGLVHEAVIAALNIPGTGSLARG
ncbi:MAG: histidinol-phosphatase [Betaproteobacteria bacterium]|nr:histidinol-phosphatase [Betaproteobacteria bacterium]